MKKCPTSDRSRSSILSFRYIANGKARLAWELYLRVESSDDSFNLLQVRFLLSSSLSLFLSLPNILSKK